MCSVRHRPMPCAPRSRAFADWSGVSALARTRRRRRASATPISRSNACQMLSPRAASSPARAFSSSDSSSGSSPTKTSPVKPSIVMTSPSFTVVPLAVKACADASIFTASAPQTAGMPRPANDGGVRVGPARRGQDALRRDHAVVVVRRRLAPDQDHLVAVPRPRLGIVRGEHDLADRGAGRRVQAAGERVRPVGLHATLEQLRVGSGRRSSAVSSSINPPPACRTPSPTRRTPFACRRASAGSRACPSRS